MAKNKIIQKIVDKFLIGKEGPSVLKNIEEKKLVDSGILDSMDILLLATEIEKKTKRTIDISKQKNFKKFNKYKDLIKI